MEILEINKIKILTGGFCSTGEVSKGSVNLKIKQQKLANLNNRKKKPNKMKTKMNRTSGSCGMINKRSYTCVIRVSEEEKVGRSVKVLKRNSLKNSEIWQD